VIDVFEYSGYSLSNVKINYLEHAMAFYELRQYKIRPGKMSEWLEFMETKIIPFQVGMGMVICASFKGEEDDSVYFWIRRFESESDRERLYDDVYQSDFWKNEVAPKVGDLIDRDAIQVQRVTPTRLSIMQ
tara:strand:- start:80 stop:472 length:393 start_codon:yes stop_codon:yes gene_type:complete